MRGRAPACFALIALVAVACAERPPTPAAPTTSAPRPSREAGKLWEGLPPGWSELEPPPFVRARAASVWTGRELFYWGGDTGSGGTPHADGALYGPVSGTWRSTSESPLSPRSSPGAVWTGREVLMWGGWAAELLDDGAAYDPATDAWRMLPAAPIGPRVPVAAVWTGQEMLVWGDTTRSSAVIDGAAYDPAADAWRPMAPAPFPLNEATGVWTGREMLVFGAQLDGNNASDTHHARGLTYDPLSDVWRPMAPFALSPQASWITWAGEEMIAWDYELGSGAYDPEADRWRPLSDLPLRFYECYPSGAVVGGTVLAWFCGLAAELDVRRGSWQAIKTPDQVIYGPPVPAGPVVLFAGAAHESIRNGLWAYRPR